MKSKNVSIGGNNKPAPGAKEPGNFGLIPGVAKGRTDQGNKPRPGAPKMGKGGSPSTKRGGK